MEIEIISFGKIAEFMANRRLTVDGIETTAQLKDLLEKEFPALADIKYKLAVNKTIIQETAELKSGDIVAFMPPFSGG
ncbi:molybdopterin synthase sulfur carrier subunit [Pedobacter frigiditerrae]|uniref:Molybdopterin synthase sulfur carrier subunit n=1 Tax=Pedobacter frigiditerrae TaxID=2530452 RepID=A0A4R0MSY4_9SPHI|nr:MoaD/ThiS family protein [Pedobacter frigiditerrae]TCC90139.1 molybdopterin synthase sulfur carrier subunit [Pedobacter frigiditerrae]